MSRHLRNIEDIFYNSLEDLKETPSAGSWEQLEAQLDKEEAVSHRKKFAGLKKMAVLAGFLLLSISIYEVHFIRDEEMIAAKEDVQTESLLHSGEQQLKNSGNDTKYSSVKPEKNTANNVVTDFLKPATAGKIEIPGMADNSQRISQFADRKQSQFTVDVTDAAVKTTAIMNEPLENVTRLESVKKINDIPSIDPGNSFLFSGKSTAVIANTANYLPAKSNPFFKPFWTISAYTAYDRSQYRLDNDIEDDVNRHLDEKSAISQREEHEPSFSTSIFASYQFKKKWSVQAGIIYSYTQIGIRPQKIYAKLDEGGDISYKYNSSSGYAFIAPGFSTAPAIGDSLNATEAKHTLTYLSVPVVAQYNWSVGKITVSHGLGLSVNTLLNAKIETEVKDAMNRETVTITRLHGLRHVYAGIVANTNISYAVNRNWSLNLMPSFKYALTSINKNNVVKTYPYSFGLGLGFAYRL